MKLLKTLGLLFAMTLPVMAANPQPLFPIPSIAALQALGAASPQYGSVNLTSYRAGLNQGGGVFNWNATSTSTPDTCTIFAATGVTTGRWIRQDINTVDVSMCGTYGDNVHDDQAAIQQAGVVAGGTLARLVTFPGQTFLVNSTITMTPGVTYRGQGGAAVPGFGAGSHGNTYLNGTNMTTGWVFDLNLPNGTDNIEAPKIYGMGISASLNNNVTGGCIRYNNINNGFTDTGSSQEYLVHAHVEFVSCLVNNDAGTNEVGIQCNKCFDGDFSNNFVLFGKYGIDLEGTDIFGIGAAGPNRVQGTVSCLIHLQTQQTFGSKNRVVGNELLYPNEGGPTLPGYVCDYASSSVIDSNHIEGNAVTTAAVSIGGGLNHVVVNNDIDLGFQSCWINVVSEIESLRAYGNTVGGQVMASACFAGTSGGSFYQGTIPVSITHGGNSANGDSGWPFNSITGTEQPLVSPVVQLWTPSTGGLNISGLGATEKPTNNAFNFTTIGTSTTFFLDFQRYQGVLLKGTFNAQVYAWAGSGTPTLTCQITDNGALVGSSSNITLTTSPKPYTIAFAQVVSTDGGIRCWAPAVTNIHMSQIALTY